ncbi:MAG: hypothetical protein IH627_09000 [Rubrivivax sp.]|nr:hypothetical protein [Rubrivivax sp.]
MTTTSHQPTGSQRKVTAVLGWFPTTPATEREILDMANSRQVALRTRLRHHYWLNDCKPLGAVTVSTLRRKMAMIDPQDAMPEEQVAELLSPHYGFEEARDDAGAVVGWCIPDLDEAQRAAVGSIVATRERMAELGRASAAKRSAVRGVTPAPMGAGRMAGPQDRARAPEVIDRTTGEIMAAAAEDDGDF